jgi:hypothetical protein
LYMGQIPVPPSLATSEAWSAPSSTTPKVSEPPKSQHAVNLCLQRGEFVIRWWVVQCKVVYVFVWKNIEALYYVRI